MITVAPMCFEGEQGWKVKDLYKDLTSKIEL